MVCVPTKQKERPQSFARRAAEDSQGGCFTAGRQSKCLTDPAYKAKSNTWKNQNSLLVAQLRPKTRLTMLQIYPAPNRESHNVWQPIKNDQARKEMENCKMGRKISQ